MIFKNKNSAFQIGDDYLEVGKLRRDILIIASDGDVGESWGVDRVGFAFSKTCQHLWAFKDDLSKRD